MNSILLFFIKFSIEGDYLPTSSVTRVKGAVEDCVGKKVKFKIKKGKSRSQFSEGVILDTYPSIFTVFVEKRDYKRIVSFNYIDILTNNVEFYICDDMETRIG
ncbi:MAG: Veg protein [Tissierellia bacterium]|jgi:uncharacterized protein Veg|nr:Veg protein [Tissierellia bacterium]